MRKAGKESPEGSSEGHGALHAVQEHHSRDRTVWPGNMPLVAWVMAHMGTLPMGLHTEAGVWVLLK